MAVEVAVGAGAEDLLCPRETSERKEGSRRCCCCRHWGLLIVPACSLLFTAALGCLALSALLSADACSVGRSYGVPCSQIREALLQSDPSFEVLSPGPARLELRHVSPLNNEPYDISLRLDARAGAGAGAGAGGACSLGLSAAPSSGWWPRLRLRRVPSPAAALPALGALLRRAAEAGGAHAGDGDGDDVVCSETPYPRSALLLQRGP